VLSRAVGLSSQVQDAAYLMQLFPRTQGQFVPFLSEQTVQFASSWVANHDLRSRPYALFYYAAGAYTLRCRDTSGNYVKLSGPPGETSPLDLATPSGRAEIWHFYFTPINVAHVFVVTEASLGAVDGPGLRMEIAKRLNTPRVWLSVRDDPWFLAAPTPLLYLFADAFKRITLEEYRASPTLVCYQTGPCRITRGQ